MHDSKNVESGLYPIAYCSAGYVDHSEAGYNLLIGNYNPRRSVAVHAKLITGQFIDWVYQDVCLAGFRDLSDPRDFAAILSPRAVAVR